VCVCHHPPGNPDNAHTICIGPAAARAHLKHGDTEGECPVPCDGDEDCGDNQFCQRTGDACDDDSVGACADIPATCPTTVNPVCGCDGVSYINECEANAAGVNIASAGECPDSGLACGGAAGTTCPADQFCMRATGSCSEDIEGVCTVLPGVCPPDFTPVCGCDGVTYSNECYAASAGASVASTGACAAGAACGGAGGGTCATGEFCRPTVTGNCATGAEGTCTPMPELCPAVLDPVCGCDGITYDNACAAAAAGIAFAHDGECDADQQACGGAAGSCIDAEFCKRPVGACASDAAGVCQPDPVSCSATVDPVCGCNGVTYSNACVADALGVTVASEGACEAPVACDGSTGVTCLTGEFCQHADGACGTENTGTCEDTPLLCDPTSDPVCGCDGITYPNACFANGAGINVSHTGPC
jgi:hypothetical protein